MISGVPQGSVLGPVLFTIFINDMPDVVQSVLRLFADDTKVGREIRSVRDTETLQSDLDALCKWSDDWLLPFNTAKCKLMHIGKNNTRQAYTMPKDGGRRNIEEVEEEKDLGVVLDDKLSFDKHILSKVSKANQVLGVIRRTFKFLDREAFMTLYKAMVRPHLEYAAPVWNPTMIKHKRLIENVQRRATKLVPELRDKPYTERLKQIGLPTLEYRRLRMDMVQTYRLTHGLEDISADRLLILDNRGHTRGHSYKIFKERSNSVRYGHSFRHRIADPWNSLDEDVVSAPTLNSFKSRLNNCYRNHQLKFTNSF
jgi:hypothetical protein